MLSRLKIFVSSLFWHIARGLPKSGKQNILARYDICKQCESYNRQYKICNECGCNISNKSIFLNKLAWADQECPLGKWGKYAKDK
jgi:ribosomal protein L37E